MQIESEKLSPRRPEASEDGGRACCARARFSDRVFRATLSCWRLFLARWCCAGAREMEGFPHRPRMEAWFDVKVRLFSFYLFIFYFDDENVFFKD